MKNFAMKIVLEMPVVILTMKKTVAIIHINRSGINVYVIGVYNGE